MLESLNMNEKAEAKLAKAKLPEGFEELINWHSRSNQPACEK
jgi:hypothetical protein